jgi:signal peptidase II
VILDQATKLWARSALSSGESREVIPGFFNLTLVYNRGAAGGAFASLAPLLVIITLVVIYGIFRLRRERSRSRILALSLGLLLGGAVGNLIDRLAFGRVTDFLDFGVVYGGHERSWPTFNVADIALVIGVLMMLYYVNVIQRRIQENRNQ